MKLSSDLHGAVACAPRYITYTQEIKNKNLQPLNVHYLIKNISLTIWELFEGSSTGEPIFLYPWGRSSPTMQGQVCSFRREAHGAIREGRNTCLGGQSATHP